MKNKGFTLIELLVVISIFGLISSIALANLQGAREQAREAAGKQFHATVLRSIGDNAIAGWEFNESAGSVAYESTGSGLDGTIYGATFTDPDEGISGPALKFANDSFVAGSNLPLVGDTGQMTIATWINPSNVAKEFNSIFLLSGDNCTLEVGIQGGKQYVYDSSGELLVEITEERIFTNNKWQNVVFTFDNESSRTYIDGSLVKTAAPVQINACNNADWSIGATVGNNNGQYLVVSGSGFEGYIDSMYIYNSSLTASEVSQKYAEDLSKINHLANI